MGIATNDRLQIRAYCQTGDQTAINVWNFVVGAVVGAPTEQGIVDAFSVKMALAYKQILSSDTTYYGCDLRVYVGGALGATWTSRSSTGAGTQGADTLPRQVAGVLSFQTGTPGRAGRGRTFLSFPPEAMNGPGGHPDNLYTGGADNLGFQLRSNVPYISSAGNTAVLQFCLRHRATNAFVLVINHVARAKWGNQRRRGDYGKKNLPSF